MNARLRLRVTLALLSLSIAYFVLVVFVHVRESVVRSRSEAIYAEFLKLHLGETTKADIEILRKRFAGSQPEDLHCNGADCSYTIGNLFVYSPLFLFSRLTHDHTPSSQLTLETHENLLSSASFSVGVLIPKGYGTRAERKWLNDPRYVPYSSGPYELEGRAWLVSTLPATRYDEQLAAGQGYRVWAPSGCMNCVAIFVSALPSLTAAKRAQVFDINFDCMTQWSTCTDKEDIMPTAGREEMAEESAPAN